MNLTPERLLEQLKAAGVSKRSPDDTLSAQDKSQLLDYLKRSHGAREDSNITLTRKSTSEVKKADGSTVTVETRKKRVVARPDDAPRAEAAKPAEPAPVAAAPVEAKPEPKPEPKVEAKPEPKPEPKVEAKPEPKPEAKPEPKPAAAPAPRTVASILSPEEIAAREAEEKRQAAFRARQEALMREKIEREERRQAAKLAASQPAPAPTPAPVAEPQREERRAAPAGDRNARPAGDRG
ncbi:translation initiation factor IF-2 associated domain-containing protein, partial [Chromobacterium vaccinii]|uniref:translation initiation factor IF-2 N-terminal domain-containing protein n=1 Tax=Chromobacterium vaccinii TaxID=1108595 RepID=UPI00325FF2C4